MIANHDRLKPERLDNAQSIEKGSCPAAPSLKVKDQVDRELFRFAEMAYGSGTASWIGAILSAKPCALERKVRHGGAAARKGGLP